ncbi:MocR-like pyridoxine biosynthesis transcription factor PdxR [Pararhodospirillum oryzae]|uniref:GntR family transcriptional regulator n=1 Tax=Pararhodospirillum oryzae TaxID=478448 RepID=A0A512H571_9PROT|nr:PLP-dependent aminotransferase family protein [Pararhodospirillum oryzae]GEO80616.1 GntR family transcriptional regulator [Pararhodospirillum oryzae]
MLPFPLDRARPAPTLQEQIYRTIRDRVIGGQLPAGARLPSTRDLARDLGVSRNTVILAFDWLAAEGYLERARGSGTFVARLLPADLPPPPTVAPPSDLSRDNALSASGENALPASGDNAVPASGDNAVPASGDNAPPAPPPIEPPVLAHEEAGRPVFDFWYGRPDPRLFPVRAWRMLGGMVLGACARGLAEYGDRGGDPALRAAIASYLAGARGLVAAPDQVIITAGAQEGLNLIARLLIEPGTPVGFEAPGYDAAARVFEAHGARIHPGRVDREGLDPASLRAARPRVVFVTPSHQFPTGAVMSLDRRRALIEQVARQGGRLVEDDYDGEIVYEGPPVAALAALDGLQRTLYVGSFSKTLGNGLRIGYVVVPRSLVPAARALKGLMSYGQSWLDQQILAAFLASGRFERHLRRLRVTCRARRDAARAGLIARFGPGLRIDGAQAGMHLYCTLPPEAPPARVVAQEARAVGVGLYPAQDSGLRAGDADLSRDLIVGYAALTPEEITRALGRLTRS